MIKLPELNFIIPMLIITGASLVSLMIAVFTKKSKYPVMIFSFLSVLIALIFNILNVSKESLIFSEALRISILSNAFAIIAIISILLTILASKDYLERFEVNYGEYYSILLFALFGMLTMIYANDLIVIFIGLEIMSVCFYILSGMMRKRMKSNESAMKYLLLGAFMTGFLLFGISLIYGTTGTTNLPKILSTFTVMKTPIFLVGVGLFTIGFFFKIGIFPFQNWIPDVYEGAPTVVSGMMSTAGKVAAVGTLTPILISLNLGDYKLIFSVLATLTMLYGNIVAITQNNLKRLLAYSSIASAGYILVGMTAMDEFANRGIAFYLLAYVFMQLGAFIAVSVYESATFDCKDFKNVTFDEYKGLAKQNPFLAIFLTVFLFSLAGIPPFAGFWGKYYIFLAAIKSNLIWLSVIAILLSLVSIYYYLKVIVYMWFKVPDENVNKVKINPFVFSSLILALFGTLLFGIYPQIFFSFFNFVLK